MRSTPEETYSDPIKPAREAIAPAGPHLILGLECERPLAGAARYSMAGADEVLIGRGGARSARRTVDGRTRRLDIAIPDRRLSTTHGRLTWTGDSWLYEDLESRNGSLLNGAPLRRGAVHDGDLLQVGHSILFVRDELPTPGGTADDVDSTDLCAEPIGMRTLVPSLAQGLRTLAKVARSSVSVLLLGETGTGKEIVARAIHQQALADRPFVAVNCGAIPATLVESQLFGHVKGAFSGAVRDELGFVRAADGGTLFLDEIGELPKPAQAALLRVLQEREVVPIGSTRAIAVNMRVITATLRPLDELVAQGEFRGDLLARLGGLTFELPPLRARREDLGLLIADLLPRFPPVRSLDPVAAQAIFAHGWPHNIRELEKALSLAAVLASGDTISAAHLPPALLSSWRGHVAEYAPGPPTPADAPLRVELIAALEKHGGNVTEVARAMGKARQQIHRWLRRLRIDPKIYRAG